MPPASITRISNGGGGSGFHSKRPSASVTASPVRPMIDTVALGHRPSLLIDDAGLEGECGQGQRQHCQKDQNG